VDFRHEQVVFETHRHRITGTLTLPHEGYRSRVSDFLNSSDQHFVALTDVEVEPLDGVTGEVTRHAFLAVARAHIVLAEPGAGADAGASADAAQA
jgi:hypothetical protein